MQNFQQLVFEYLQFAQRAVCGDDAYRAVARVDASHIFRRHFQVLNIGLQGVQKRIASAFFKYRRFAFYFHFVQKVEKVAPLLAQ